MLRPATARRMASRIWSRKRRKKRSRLPIDLFLPDKRLSMTCWSMVISGLVQKGRVRRGTPRTSGALANPQVPVTQQPNLPRGVALGDHPVDEVLVFLLLVRTGFGIE